MGESLDSLGVDQFFRSTLRIPCFDKQLFVADTAPQQFISFVYPVDGASKDIFMSLAKEVSYRFSHCKVIMGAQPSGGFFTLDQDASLEAQVFSRQSYSSVGWVYMKIVFEGRTGFFYIAIDQGRVLFPTVDRWSRELPAEDWFWDHYFEGGVYCGPEDYPCTMYLDGRALDLSGLRSVEGDLYARGLTTDCLGSLKHVTGLFHMKECLVKSIGLIGAGSLDICDCPLLEEAPHLLSVGKSFYLAATPLHRLGSLRSRDSLMVGSVEDPSYTPEIKIGSVFHSIPVSVYKDRMEVLRGLSIPQLLETLHDPWSTSRAFCELRLRGGIIH